MERTDVLLRLRRHLQRQLPRGLGRGSARRRRGPRSATGAHELVACDLSCLLHIARAGARARASRCACATSPRCWPDERTPARSSTPTPSRRCASAPARRSPTTSSRGNLRDGRGELGGGAGADGQRAPVRARCASAGPRDPARQHPAPARAARPAGGAGAGRGRHRGARRRRRGGLPLHHRPRGGAGRAAWSPSRSRWRPRRSSSTRPSRRRACGWSRPTSASGSSSSPASTRATSSPRPCTSTASRSASCFEAESGEHVPDDREALVAHARRRLREVFAAADIGHLGRQPRRWPRPGTLCVVENEGNVRLVTALPRIHVARDGDGAGGARTGTRPRTSSSSSRWRRSATTRPTYVNLITGPRAPDEADGPEELHLVLLDGGRGALRGTDLRGGARLHPLRRLPLLVPRCGAASAARPTARPTAGRSAPCSRRCSRACEASARRSCPSSSSLCGACHDACPVGIPLHDLLVRVRARVTTPAHRRDRRAVPRSGRAPGAARCSTGRRRLGARLGLRVLGRRGWMQRLPGPGGRWTGAARPAHAVAAAPSERRAPRRGARAAPGHGERIVPAADAAGAAADRVAGWGERPGAARGRPGARRARAAGGARGRRPRDAALARGAGPGVARPARPRRRGRDLRRHRSRPARWPSGAPSCWPTGPGHGRAIDVVEHAPPRGAPGVAHARDPGRRARGDVCRAGRRPPSAVSLVSAPSRTSDIEKISTLGAHGAMALHLLVVEDR